MAGVTFQEEKQSEQESKSKEPTVEDAKALTQNPYDESVVLMAAFRNALSLQMRFALDAAVRGDMLRQRHAIVVIQFTSETGPQMVARSLCRLTAVVASDQVMGKISSEAFLAFDRDNVAQQEESLGASVVPIAVSQTLQTMQLALTARKNDLVANDVEQEVIDSVQPRYISNDIERLKQRVLIDGCENMRTRPVDAVSATLQDLLRARMEQRDLHEVLIIAAPVQYATAVHVFAWQPTPVEGMLYITNEHGGTLV